MEIGKRKIDNRSIYAIIVIIVCELSLDYLWPFIGKQFPEIKPILHYRKLLTILLFIIPIVIIFEKDKFYSIGLKLYNWRKTLLVTVITTLAALVVVYLTAVIWKFFGQLRVEGDMVYFIGMRFPHNQIVPSILYLMLADQILTVALPEEIIYRGYFQSRLNYSWGPLVAIMGSTLVFALTHVDRPLMVCHLLILGPLYGYAFYYSKSIYPTVIAHCFSNIGGILIIKHVALG